MIFSLFFDFFFNNLIGVPREVELTEAAYKSALFSGTAIDVPVNRFHVNSDRKMTRIEQYKRGISDSCTKVFVENDKITCTPLKKFGKYI